MSDLTPSEPAPTQTATPIPDECPTEEYIHPGSKDIWLIVYVSLALGVVSFLAFCVGHPQPCRFEDPDELTLCSFGAHDGRPCIRRGSVA